MFIRDIAYAAPEPVHYAFRIPAYTMINLRHRLGVSERKAPPTGASLPYGFLTILVC